MNVTLSKRVPILPNDWPSFSNAPLILGIDRDSCAFQSSCIASGKMPMNVAAKLSG